MKIIDLLNKIANGEEVPKWVVYDKKEYTYKEEYKDYVHEAYNNGTMLFLLSEIFNKNGIDIVLNQELDFIEEKNKILEKIEIYEDEDGHYFIDNHCKKLYIACDEINFMVEEFNQLIDYIKNKGE